MGFRFNWQAYLSSFSPYFLLFGCELQLPASFEQDATVVIDMDDFNVWIQACEQQTTLFQRVMPIGMEKWAIAQQEDTLCYATIRGGGYHFQIWRFEWRDYVYL